MEGWCGDVACITTCVYVTTAALCSVNPQESVDFRVSRHVQDAKDQNVLLRKDAEDLAARVKGLEKGRKEHKNTRTRLCSRIHDLSKEVAKLNTRMREFAQESADTKLMISDLSDLNDQVIDLTKALDDVARSEERVYSA